MTPDLNAINDALIQVDPLAMADLDANGQTLRVVVELASPGLLELLARAGLRANWHQLEEVPAVCCGACGG